MKPKVGLLVGIVLATGSILADNAYAAPKPVKKDKVVNPTQRFSFERTRSDGLDVVRYVSTKSEDADKISASFNSWDDQKNNNTYAQISARDVVDASGNPTKKSDSSGTAFILAKKSAGSNTRTTDLFNNANVTPNIGLEVRNIDRNNVSGSISRTTYGATLVTDFLDNLKLRFDGEAHTDDYGTTVDTGSDTRTLESSATRFSAGGIVIIGLGSGRSHIFGGYKFSNVDPVAMVLERQRRDSHEVNAGVQIDAGNDIFVPVDLGWYFSDSSVSDRREWYAKPCVVLERFVGVPGLRMSSCLGHVRSGLFDDSLTFVNPMMDYSTESNMVFGFGGYLGQRDGVNGYVRVPLGDKEKRVTIVGGGSFVSDSGVSRRITKGVNAGLEVKL